MESGLKGTSRVCRGRHREVGIVEFGLIHTLTHTHSGNVSRRCTEVTDASTWTSPSLGVTSSAHALLVLQEQTQQIFTESYLRQDVLWSGGFVCWLVRLFVTLDVISRKVQVRVSWNFAGTDVQHLRQMSLLTCARSRSTFKVEKEWRTDPPRRWQVVNTGRPLTSRHWLEVGYVNLSRQCSGWVNFRLINAVGAFRYESSWDDCINESQTAPWRRLRSLRTF